MPRSGETRCATKRINDYPESPGPCAMVLFGVTGDLAHKKVVPAIYDLANRGLLPPTFSLVGFARRDWDHDTFAQVILDDVKEHCRTPFRQAIWERLADGLRFVRGEFDDEAAFARLAETLEKLDAERGTGSNHAFYLAIPPKSFPVVCEQLHKSGLARPQEDTVEPGRHRETLRPRPQERVRSQPRGQLRVPGGVGIPDRPLPGQGDGAEHLGAAVRQSVLGSDLERALRRSRADHHGRRHRTRRARRLLRRHRRRPRCHPEPSDAIAGADRDGRAGQLQSVGAAGRKDQGALGHPTRRAA